MGIQSNRHYVVGAGRVIVNRHFSDSKPADDVLQLVHDLGKSRKTSASNEEDERNTDELAGS